MRGNQALENVLNNKFYSKIPITRQSIIRQTQLTSIPNNISSSGLREIAKIVCGYISKFGKKICYFLTYNPLFKTLKW